MVSPLDDILVIEIDNWMASPSAGAILADLGARVIKIEPPGGDITRGMGTAAGNMTAFFLNINRGKRDLCLDLKSSQGQEIVKRLVITADVVVQNFRPGVMEKMGLGYDNVKELKSDLI